jgi:hypothetical protein
LSRGDIPGSEHCDGHRRPLNRVEHTHDAEELAEDLRASPSDKRARCGLKLLGQHWNLLLDARLEVTSFGREIDV